ncbi:uncharacterized protein [Mytilus edulis]|uniref:uncharacterized protein n=1 Tax=Mytilus edulis TaxID=6550 RepID=UPI0039EE2B8F
MIPVRMKSIFQERVNIKQQEIIYYSGSTPLLHTARYNQGFPKIMVVLTHKDQVKAHDVEERRHEIFAEIYKMFQQTPLEQHLVIEDQLFVNAKDENDTEMEKIKKIIMSESERQPTWGELLPKCFIPLELEFASLIRRNITLITLEHVNKINALQPIRPLSKDELKVFLKLQHSIGKLLYFDEPKLDDRIILSPTLLIDAFKSIVTDKQFCKGDRKREEIWDGMGTKGVVSKYAIDDVWKSKKYAKFNKDKDYLLTVMTHLDILVEPKRYDTSRMRIPADFYYVASMVRSSDDSGYLHSADITQRNVAIAFQSTSLMIPPALSFRFISYCLSVWSVKRFRETNSEMLFHRSGVFTIDPSLDMYILCEDDKISARLVHARTNTLIMRDLASSINECLTSALEQISQLYIRTSSDQSDNSDASFVTRICCNSPDKPCILPLENLAYVDKIWKCPAHGIEHPIHIIKSWIPGKSLIFAAGNKEEIEKCLEQGANINNQNWNGSTALHDAAWNGRTEIVRLLIDRGIDINLPNNDGSTALHNAAWSGQTEIVRLLIDRGTNISLQNENGSTALHLTALNEQTDIVGGNDLPLGFKTLCFCFLLKDLQRLNSLADTENNNRTKTSLLQTIEYTEEKLGKLYYEKIKGNQIRARAKWVEEGEKNSAYFLGLAKSRQSKKTITQLYDEKGEITRDHEKILNLEVKYYKDLYTSTNPNLQETQNYLKDIKKHKKLSESESDACEGEITEEECTEAIFKMKLNRAPGLDGLNVEFYRKFWVELKTLIVSTFNYCFTKGQMSNTQKIGVISLIYKKNDPLSLDNYRPITLLNYDVKLLAYALAQRLKPLLHKLVHSDKKGYIKNRYIGFNIRRIQDAIDYSENLKIDGAVLFLDFSKAFDSLELIFMYETLKKVGFKESFFKMDSTNVFGY